MRNLIRLGDKEDGGYVVPKLGITNLDAHISLGVGKDWSFERDLMKFNPNLTIHAYDHTVTEKGFLKDCLLHACMLFFSGSINKIRTNFTKYTAFKKFFKSNVLHFRERVYNRIDNYNDVTIEEIFSRLEGKYTISLKMDIEGGEYRIINDLIEFHKRISLLIIEFHNTDPLREIFSKKIKYILEHFNIVHVHGNNFEGISIDNLPEFLEITFLHRRFFSERCASRNHLPIPGLDFPDRKSVV